MKFGLRPVGKGTANRLISDFRYAQVEVDRAVRWAVPILRMARKLLQTDRRSAHDQDSPPNYPPKGVFLVLKLKFYTKIFAL